MQLFRSWFRCNKEVSVWIQANVSQAIDKHGNRMTNWLQTLLYIQTRSLLTASLKESVARIVCSQKSEQHHHNTETTGCRTISHPLHQSPSSSDSALFGSQLLTIGVFLIETTQHEYVDQQSFSPGFHCELGLFVTSRQQEHVTWRTHLEANRGSVKVLHMWYANCCNGNLECNISVRPLKIFGFTMTKM